MTVEAVKVIVFSWLAFWIIVPTVWGFWCLFAEERAKERRREPREQWVAVCGVCKWQCDADSFQDAMDMLDRHELVRLEAAVSDLPRTW